MKALVTGASGFVGQHLVSHLLTQGYKVITTGHTEGSPFDQSVSYVWVDLTRELPLDFIDFTQIDVVFHLAGLAAVGPSFNEPRKYIETNAAIQINLFETCLAQAASPRFIIISSGSLYDTKAPLPLTELSPTSPSSPYAVSKLGQETLAQYYGARGFETIIARPFNHIGPGQSPGFLVPDLISKIQVASRNDQKSIAVGNLETKRDYTDVRDIVRAYEILAKKGRVSSTYNICSGKAISGHKILALLMELMGKQFEAKTDPALLRPTDVPERYGSFNKLHKDTGWEPHIGLEQTLKDVLVFSL